MDDKKSISVIVPVYNAEKYLAETVKCILNQTYKNYELLLIDDGSSDSSPSLCDGFANEDNRVRVFHNENMGPAGARNFGLTHAAGEFIAFVDSDDLIETDYLEQLLQSFENPEVDLALCGFDRFYNDDPTKQQLYLLGTQDVQLLESVKDVALLFTVPKTSLSGVSIWAKLYRRSIIIEHGIEFPMGITYEEDCCFNLLYYRHIRKAVTIKKNLYHYRQVSNSLSKAYKKSLYRDLLNGYRERVSFFQELDMEEYIKKLDAILLIVTFNNMKKIATSSMSFLEKRKAYKDMLDYEETKRVINEAGLSKVRMTRYLTIACRYRMITVVSMILFLWKLRGGDRI